MRDHRRWLREARLVITSNVRGGLNQLSVNRFCWEVNAGSRRLPQLVVTPTPHESKYPTSVQHFIKTMTMISTAIYLPSSLHLGPSVVCCWARPQQHRSSCTHPEVARVRRPVALAAAPRPAPGPAVELSTNIREVSQSLELEKRKIFPISLLLTMFKHLSHIMS